MNFLSGKEMNFLVEKHFGRLSCRDLSRISRNMESAAKSLMKEVLEKSGSVSRSSNSIELRCEDMTVAEKVNSLFKNFFENCRVRKRGKKYAVRIRGAEDISSFYRLFGRNWRKAGKVKKILPNERNEKERRYVL